MSDRDDWDVEEKEDPYSHIDKDEQQALRAEGAAEFGRIIRESIGDPATHRLESQVAEGANDPLTAIEAKPVAERTRNDWGDLFASGRCDWEAIPEATRREMDLRS